MISNTKDIWRLESKWSDHDRFWTDHDRKLAEVSYDFFSISLAPTNIVVSGHTKNYGKLKEFLPKNTETSAEERDAVSIYMHNRKLFKI